MTDRSTGRGAASAYRENYRASFTSAAYSGWRHIALVLASVAGLISALLFWAPDATALQWGLVAASTVATANLVEYWMHRGPMHHPTHFLRSIFERHALRHHRYFACDDMAIASHRDLHAVLFPQVLLISFATIALVLGLLIGMLSSPSVTFEFAICCMAYYLIYEMLHLFYHLPGAHRVPVLGYLARLHRIHHNPNERLCNFNLTFPLFDWIMGTLDDTDPKGLGQKNL